jgi:hypothetical protein
LPSPSPLPQPLPAPAQNQRRFEASNAILTAFLLARADLDTWSRCFVPADAPLLCSSGSPAPQSVNAPAHLREIFEDIINISGRQCRMPEVRSRHAASR